MSIRAERVAQKEEFVDVVEDALRGIRGPRLVYEDLDRMVDGCAEEASHLGREGPLHDTADFLRAWREGDEAILRLVVPGSEGKFAFRLLDPGVLSRPVFAGVHGSILMSGTLHPPEMYADLLGIPEARRRSRRYLSPFPKENRLLLVHPHVTTVYDRRTDSMHDLTAREIASIATAVPGNLAVFFPSYELLAKALERLRGVVRKPLIVERPDWDKARRDATLEALRIARGDGGALLLGVQGGSLSEGVDYVDNLLAAVVIVGLPLSPPNVEVEALKDYYAKRFGPERGHAYAYLFPAVNKVLQAAGRPIRSERDRAAIVLLESRLVTPRYARHLPRDFNPEISSTPATIVDRFLKGPLGAHCVRPSS